MPNSQLQNIKGVFFDLDGTLIDTAPDFVNAVNTIRAEYDQAPLPRSQIQLHVSEGATGLIKACVALPHDSQALFLQTRERLLDLYEASNHQASSLFEGAQTFLEQLEQRQIPWGIVTNKPERFATPLIKQLQLENRLCCLLCPDHVAQKKPHPESLFLAASTAKVLAHECFYFGDHNRDILAGKAANMVTGSVGFGYFPETENPLSWQADYHFESFSQINQEFFGD